ncbi:MAG TPA: hypothetical protein VL443_01780 [Cyclobacteriaceae bacterium]|nr:hypothetical protein [Cyclobacteriaceae bacterium]
MPSFSNLTNLKYFSVEYNQLTGALPSFAAQKEMLTFYVDNNQFTGSFPDVTLWTKVTDINVSVNSLSGIIPASIANCVALVSLSAGNNSFTSLPAGLISLPVLGLIDFNTNALTSIPDFSTQVNKANLTLNVNKNKLDFGQLEMIYNKGIKTIYYNPQNNLEDVLFAKSVPSGSLSITARSGGVNTIINWERKVDGSSTWVNVNSLNTDATQKTYQHANNQYADAGEYRYKLTNSVITGFTIQSSSIDVRVGYDQTWSNLTNVTNTSGVLSKSTANGWNGEGARARNTLMANVDGWFEFVIDPNAATANYMIGFSAINNVYTQTAIDFGVEVVTQSSVLKLLAHEGSTTGTDLGSVALGDVIRVGRVGSLMKYYKNGTEIRSVTGAASKYYITKVLINAGKTAPLVTSYDVLNETGEIPDALEQAALKDMYDSLGGSAWTNSPYWPTTGTWPVNKTSSYGASISNGDISVIFLAPSHLVGKIPASIGNLTKVTQLNLTGNAITGSIPSTMGNMTSLQYLYLGQNQITGTTPASLGNLTNLLTLSLGYNQISGSIPTELNNLKNLTYLSFAVNKLTGDITDLSGLTNLTSIFFSYNPTLNAGPIPVWLKNLKKLNGLYLINTNRTGSIPAELGKLTALGVMDLSSNSLTGSIPTSFGKLTNLTYLQLTTNQLTGSIPDSLGYLTKLQTLSLNANQLSGSIPSTFSNLTSMVNLYLYNNKLTGSIPSFFGNYSQLVNLYLYNNLLTGEIPSSLGNLTKLVNFQLQTNQLTGSIPSSLGNLINLQYFLISTNQLTGTIPPELGNLNKVVNFYISANQLTGEIPSTLGNLTAVSQLVLSDNKLTGQIPTSLSSLSNLTALYLQNNNLSGTVPSIFTPLTKLVLFNAYNNQFTGAFPSSIGSCTLLTNFDIHTNKFTSVPSSLLSLPVLSGAIIQDNELTSIPDFSTAVNKANLTLSIYSNRLDFYQLEQVVGKGIKAVNYNAQNPIIDINFVSLVTGSALTIPARNSGQYSTITWEKLSGTTWNSVNSLDNDATLKTYTRTSAASTDAGTYRWRMTNSVVSGTIMSGSIAVETGLVADALEFAALKDFYDSLGGATWTNKTNWPTAGSWPTSATATQMDAYNGITVANGDITRIDLFTNNLTGFIPTTISKLKALQFLRIQGNPITGKIPSSIGQITSLTYLNLSATNISGSIPSSIGSLSNLYWMGLYNMPQLGGDIPASIFNMPALQNMYIYNTNVGGAIPQQIVLPQIKLIYLYRNKISGTLPASLSTLTTLTNLAIEGNPSLTGPIPTDIGNLTHLTELWLNENSHTGTIPSSIGKLVNLKYLMLQTNQLEGEIPTSLKNLVNLDYTAFASNKLSGSIPGLFGRMPGLDSLWLANNQFTGSIPDSLGYASSLALLSVDNNKLTGSIPTSLGSLPLMKTLTVSHNDITGTIPDQLQNLTNIKNLDLSHTLITGAVPAWLVNMSKLRGITLNDGKFTSLPNFSTRTDKNLLKIAVENNQLPVADIEQNFTAASTQPFATFTYSPQVNTVTTPALEKVKLTETLTIEAPSGGTNGVYLWEKLQNSTWTNVNSLNTSTTPNIFVLPNVTASDGGTYRYTVSNSWVPGLTFQTTLDVNAIDPIVDAMETWAFQYKYDARRRIIGKKVPGADWTYTVYDQRDRPVMIQDGEQRKINQWSYIKYDRLNRSIISGLYTHNQAASQDDMSALISTTNFFETYNGDANNHGYTNTVFSSVDFPGAFEVLSITYYDDYSFKDGSLKILNDSQYDYKSDEYDEQYKYDASGNSFARVTGHETGSKTKVLGENTYLWSVNYFDDRYRQVQNISTNIRGGVDRTTSVYDFVGKALKTKTVHDINTATPQTVARTMYYDHAGRTNWIKHSVNGASDVVLVKNEYNELGQLVDKKLHSINTDGSDAKQSIDYRYNIRGWLTNMNDVDNPEASDLFSMNLNYNTPTANGGAAQYNGNISEMLWKGPDTKFNSYGYTYDPMNRFVEAKYYNASEPIKNGRFNEKIWDDVNNKSGYDLNGNIRLLTRGGKTGLDALGITTYGQMDNLTYIYNGNQLLSVSEASEKTQGFIDGTNTGDDYTYDANGNMDVDNNKNISAIVYNHLNLPDKVTKNTGDYIKYSYSASGKKLKQEVYDGANALKKKTDYVGDFFYENDTLKFINHEEGRVVVTGSESEYQYYLKDHLGNVRLTFTSKQEEQEDLATLEASNQISESGKFLRYSDVRFVNSYLVDHTNDTNGLPSGNAMRLSGGTNEREGLAKSIAVMPGDKITMEVYAKYVDPSADANNFGTALQTLLGYLAAPASAPAGTIIDGQGYASSTSSFPSNYLGLLDKTGSTGGPKAYMNYVVFDHDFNFKNGGFVRMGTTAKEDGSNVLHELLSASVNITEAGYVYIYLSNEEATPVEVYFDDFKVTQIESPVVSGNDYYPFGLTYNSYSRENSVPNKFKFQDQEHVDDLGLNWDSFKWRNHQPDIGRFFNIDPLADKYVYNSPYAFSENKVIAHRELEGLESVKVTGFSITKTGKEVEGKVDAESEYKDNTVETASTVKVAEGKVIVGFEDKTPDKGIDDRHTNFSKEDQSNGKTITEKITKDAAGSQFKLSTLSLPAPKPSIAKALAAQTSKATFKITVNGSIRAAVQASKTGQNEKTITTLLKEVKGIAKKPI